MSNLNNITSKILKDSEEKRDAILKKAEDEKNKIVSKKIDEAEKLKLEMIEKANIEAITRKERIVSSSELKVRNEKLVSKGKVIDLVFERSIDKLSDMDSESFKSFVRNTILNSNISGDENIILNDFGRENITDSFIEEINKSLRDKGNLKISNEIGKFRGGFILERNGIEINNTFEALVNSKRDELEFEIANVLFN